MRLNHWRYKGIGNFFCERLSYHGNKRKKIDFQAHYKGVRHNSVHRKESVIEINVLPIFRFLSSGEA